MDNQATKHIKKFLTKNECKLQLVEPHNHRVNAAERAVQTFKDTFIAALAMTDSNFPLQLWDKITPQVQDMLNMMRASRTDPTNSAYEALNGPYNWNRYPLAPLGCKAVIWRWGLPWIMGITQGWRMVSWSLEGSLPMQFLFHPRNKSVPNFWINWIVPPTLSITMFDAASAFQSTHRRIGWGGW